MFGESCWLSRHRNRSNIRSRFVLVICDVRWIANQGIRKSCPRSMGNNSPVFVFFQNRSIEELRHSYPNHAVSVFVWCRCRNCSMLSFSVKNLLTFYRSIQSISVLFSPMNRFQINRNGSITMQYAVIIMSSTCFLVVLPHCLSTQ